MLRFRQAKVSAPDTIYEIVKGLIEKATTGRDEILRLSEKLLAIDTRLTKIESTLNEEESKKKNTTKAIKRFIMTIALAAIGAAVTVFVKYYMEGKF